MTNWQKWQTAAKFTYFHFHKGNPGGKAFWEHVMWKYRLAWLAEK